ncbi:hypothetical protein V1318_02515 [Lysobacter sp. CCNWLW3]|uniref:hypothetical protein n=1 Tax=unclassified Lysobacter TaxID=2635362 RepID=UPI002FD738BF
MGSNAAETKKLTLLDGVLAIALVTLFIAYIAAGGTPENEWRASAGNALLGLNVFAWGIALFLAYRWPDSSLLLQGLAWLSSRFPTRASPVLTLCWSVFFLFVGALMFFTGAGLA